MVPGAGKNTSTHLWQWHPALATLLAPAFQEGQDCLDLDHRTQESPNTDLVLLGSKDPCHHGGDRM